MSAWLDYRLSDFLMFSPRVYGRLLELYNAAVWPLHVFAVLLGLALLVLAVREAGNAARMMAAILAAAWMWVAVAFLHQRYASINWAAEYVAIAFIAEALWLLRVAWRAPSVPTCWKGGVVVKRIGLAMMLLAVVYPLTAMAKGRPWLQAEFFGLMPDPTLIATLGALLVWRGTFRLWGAIVPVLCCVASGATSWTLDEPLAWLAPVMAMIASVALIVDRLTLTPRR